jgi:peptidyl-prolyl cis-trans isomerase D
MLKSLQNRDRMMRIMLGFVIGLIALMMIITLVPGTYTGASDPATTVATVGDQQVTVNDVERQLQRITQQQQMPPALKGLYARQIADQLIYEKMLEAEANRLGMRVTDEEHSERIKRLLPTVFVGNTFVGMERYTAEVQTRFQITVPEFEDLIRTSLLENKFRQLVTDGIRVTPDEVMQEFKQRNEKVKLEYVVIKPGQLEAKINPSDADLKAYYEKNVARYQLPERRSARYILLDNAQIGAKTTVSEDELRAYYNQNIQLFQLKNRAKISRIMFSTLGKTDAEVQEIRKKAEDVLKKARGNAKFGDLAKQYSDDAKSKNTGGDLGWIEPGQTEAAFEQAAFTLPKGKVSDLLQTQIGFDIIRVEDRESARTQTLDEVRAKLQAELLKQKSERAALDLSDKLADAIRRTGNLTIEQLGQQFSLPVNEIRPVAAGEPILELGGANKDLEGELFRLRTGVISNPIHIDRGFAVIALKEVLPSRQAALEEVRDKVLADLRRERAIEQAGTLAKSLAEKTQSGNLAAAAKAAGLESKTSELFARTGSVTDLGSGKQLAKAFTMKPGESSGAIQLGANWAIFRVAEHQDANLAEFDKQKRDVEQALLSAKRGAAYDAFREALKKRMTLGGKVVINEQALTRLAGRSGSL